MKTAIWIIAICEIVRAVQNAIQLIYVHTRSDESQIKRATDAFIESLKEDWREE